MSPKVEKIDEWHFAQSLLKQSQIIETTQQRRRGRQEYKRSTEPFRKWPHKISSIVVSRLVYQAASQMRHWLYSGINVSLVGEEKRRKGKAFHVAKTKISISKCLTNNQQSTEMLNDLYGYKNIFPPFFSWSPHTARIMKWSLEGPRAKQRLSPNW